MHGKRLLPGQRFDFLAGGGIIATRLSQYKVSQSLFSARLKVNVRAGMLKGIVYGSKQKTRCKNLTPLRYSIKTPSPINTIKNLLNEFLKTDPEV